MRWSIGAAAVVVAAVLAVWAVGSRERRLPGSEPPNTATREGISFSIASDGTGLRLLLQDGSGGPPLRGPRPRVWLDGDGTALDESACRERIRRWLDGRLAERPSVDLNGWRILVRNEDNTLSVIDPESGFRRTRLEALITLAGRSEDWALSPDGRALYVTVPERNLVSFVDLRTFRLEGSVGVGRRPGTVAVAPDGRTVWVANEGEGTVSVVDVETRREAARLESDPGRAHIAFHEPSGEVWVATALGDRVRVFDGASRGLMATVPIGAGAMAIEHNPVARAIYVGRTNGEVLEIDPAARGVVRRFQARAGATRLRSDPSGRWLMAANAGAGALEVIDTSSGRIRSTITGLDRPDAIDFSKDFTYLRTGGTGALALVETSSLGSAADPTRIDVAVGQKRVETSTRGGVLARAPVPGTFVVAHEADRAIYVYAEGMMAPIATHLNYGRTPKAVLILDRSLQEAGPGSWVSRAPVPAGRYMAAVLLDSPKVAACFPVDLGGGSAAVGRDDEPQVVWHEAPDEPLVVGTRQTLRLPLPVDPASAGTVDVLIFRLGGNLQWRLPATVRDGAAELDFEPPLPGRYRVILDVPGPGARSQTRAFEWRAARPGEGETMGSLR